MEINTCEQYVLAELDKTQKEKAALEEQLAESKAENEKVKEAFDELHELVRLFQPWIRFDGVHVESVWVYDWDAASKQKGARATELLVKYGIALPPEPDEAEEQAEEVKAPEGE